MRAFLLMFVALALTILLTPAIWLAQHIRYPLIGRPLTRLWWDTAIGLDQLGGAILYGEPDWTISSRTYWLGHLALGVSSRTRALARAFERVIDFFFGMGHCARSYDNEFGGRE